MSEAPVAQIGNYKVIRKLASGAMGVVCLAEHVGMGRQVAIKLLHAEVSEDLESVTRFFNEARATARVQHRGIVQVLDFGILPDGRAYTVMELLQGETLGSYLRRAGKLSGDPSVVLGIVRQIASALAAAHNTGIVHRDVKPENVFLCVEGGALDVAIVKVFDFGLAKPLSRQTAGLTRTGQLVGTPVYLSPEQCKGSKNIDHRVDIYALGCIAFELLTGGPVFLARSMAEMITSHMLKEPPPLHELEPSVPRAFTDLVIRMLAKQPEDRPGRMEDIVAAIDATGGTSALRADSVVLSSSRPLRFARSSRDPFAGGQDAAADEPPLGATVVISPGGKRATRRHGLWAAVAGAILAFGGGLVVVRRSQDHEKAPPIGEVPPTLAAPVPATVDIVVEDPPPGLTVTVDGAPGRLPVSLPRGPQNHTLVFQANGYEPETRTLDGTESQALTLRMRPATRTLPAAQTPTPVIKSGRRKGGRRAGTPEFLDI